MIKFTCSLMLLLAFLSPLNSEEIQPLDVNFSSGNNGFVGDFSDYPVNQEAFFELAWGWENVPEAQSGDDSTSLKKGLFLAGNNHSDDLWMFVKRRIEGLMPNRSYFLTFSIVIETDVPTDQMGAGGSPGEGVTVKVGASTREPKKVNKQGYYQMNIDKGNQAIGGKNALVIGDLSNPLVDPENRKYQPKQLNGGSLQVNSDKQGCIWIFIGSDSGFEAKSKFYITEVKVDLQSAD
jgi:hypothetical protein